MTAQDLYEQWLLDQEAGAQAPIYLPPLMDFETLMPMSPLDIGEGMEEPYGVPEDWDYKGELGPNNEELPVGAIGWTPQGDPYYGGGLAGWFNGFWNQLVHPDKTISGEEHISSASDKLKSTFEDVIFNPDLSVGQRILGQVSGFLGAAGEFITGLGAPDTEEEDAEGGGIFDVAEDISSFAVRGVAGLAGGLFKGLEGAAELTEQILFGVPEGFKEVAGMGWDIPDIPIEGGFFDDIGFGQWFPELLEDVIDLAAMPIYMAGAWIAPGTAKEKWGVIGDHFQAGRIAYSNMIDPTLEEEYIRRYRGREDPVLLAMELGNPMAELAGELFFDPLNFVGKITKPLRMANRISDAKTRHIAAASDEIAEALKTVEAVDDIDAATKTTNLVGAIQNAAESTKAKRLAFFDDIGITSLTQDAKRSASLESSNDFFGHLAAAARGTGDANWIDNSLESIHALMKMQSPDAAIVAEGLAELRHISPLPIEMMMSESAFELGHIMLNAFGDDVGKFSVNGFKKLFDDKLVFADDLADLMAAGNKADIEKFVKAIKDPELQKYVRDVIKTGEKLTGEAKGVAGAVEKAFFGNSPADVEGIRQMMQVQGMNDILKERIYKSIDDLIPTLAERAAAGEKLGAKGRAILAMEKWKASKPIRFIDTFFANVYMGASPGYVMRNLFVDRGTVFVDTGGLFRRGKPMSKTYMSDKMTRRLGGVLPVATTKGIGQVGLTDIPKFGLLQTAGDVERNSGILAMYRSVEDTMNKLVSFGDGGTVSLRALTDAGMEKKIYQNIPRMLLKNDYDVVKTMEEFRGMLKNGLIDEFATGAWIPDTTREALEAYLLTPHLDDITDAKSVEDAQDALEGMKKTQAANAKQSTGAGVASDLQNSAESAGNVGAFGDDVPDAIMLRRHAQRDANQAAEQGYLDAMERILNGVVDPQSKKIATQKLDDLNKWYKAQVGELTDMADSSHATFGNRGDKLLANPQKWWDELGIADDFPAQFSPSADGQILNDIYWQRYWERMQGRGTDLRTAFKTKLDEIVKPLETPGVMRKPIGSYHEWVYADELMDTAEKYDNIIQVGKDYYSLGPEVFAHERNITELALMNEVRLKSGNRLFDNHLMNILKNKEYLEAAGVELPKGFRHYTQLEYDDVVKIFQSRAEIKGLGFVDVAKAPLTLPAGSAKRVDDLLARAEPLHSAAIIATGQSEKKIVGALEKLLRDAGISDDIIARAFEESFISKAETGLSGTERFSALVGDDLVDIEGADVILQKLEIMHSSALRATEGTVSREKLTSGIQKLLKEAGVSDEIIDLAFAEGFIEAAETGASGTERFAELIRESLKTEDTFKDPIRALRHNVDAAPTQADAFGQGTSNLEKIFKQLELGIDRNWGRTRAVADNPQFETALVDLEKEMRKVVTEGRVIASEVATETRNFALHNYSGRYNADTVVSLFYPYHFWHSRTYANWAKRIATNPGVLAGYAKYKSALAEIHANAPDWWRFNVNTNELFGIDMKNPLFFNLESTINPLYGLVGPDFNDPYRRVDGFTGFMDDMNKFGPSLWTPLTVALATSMKMQGHDEAASRWAGRLIPQTKTLDAILSIIGAPGGAEDVEIGDVGGFASKLDPLLAIFSDGQDPYEKRRTGYALAVMIEEGIITEAQAIDAAQQASGEIWDAARERAVRQGAWGQITSQFLGVGFKARNQLDLQIQKFDTERRALMNNRHNLSPEDYKRQWALLEAIYPFADLVMLSRKDSWERDVAYTYNVLGRLPPGNKDDFYEATGLDPDMISAFYESKGDVLEEWNEADVRTFMDGMLNLGAILKTPDDATQIEWDFARAQYAQYNKTIETLFGEDIQDKISIYFNIRETDVDAAYTYMDLNPEVGAAMDMKAKMIEASPTSPFATYYGSISTLEGYYKGQMYDAIEKELGKDIFDKLDAYYSMPSRSAERRQYRREHPEIGDYFDMRDEWIELINRRVIAIGGMLEVGTPPELRTTSMSFSQQKAVASLSSQPREPSDYTSLEWQQLTGTDYQFITGWLFGKRKIPFEVEQRLKEVAEELNISFDKLLQLIGISLQ